MKRWPLVASFVLFIALCATLAYWAMQFFKPPLRQVAAPPPSAQAPVNIDAAASLFGGKGSAAVASNFQLKGVIMAGTAADSVAILAADGKPAQAVRANAEVLPGVKVKEVNRGYVILLDNGVEKRVELPEENKLASGIGRAGAAPVATAPLPARPTPAMPATVVNNPGNAASSSASPGTSGPASVTSGSSAANSANSANAANTGNTGNTAAAGAQQSLPTGSTPPAAGTPAATPQVAAPSAAPGTGMGSPPITSQGSLAGSATPPPPVPASVPGMPVTPQPPRP